MSQRTHCQTCHNHSHSPSCDFQSSGLRFDAQDDKLDPDFEPERESDSIAEDSEGNPNGSDDRSDGANDASDGADSKGESD